MTAPKKEYRHDCDYLRREPSRLEVLCGIHTDSDDDQEEGEPASILGTVLDRPPSPPKPSRLAQLIAARSK